MIIKQSERGLLLTIIYVITMITLLRKNDYRIATGPAMTVISAWSPYHILRYYEHRPEQAE